MYLKSIKAKGFKSFPDRTVLEFQPGVSVVVGPNGSGKSNITDAVLWALGEQSPVAVRGQSMQDVIFAGAPGRQAATQAEVELVLDDSEDSLGLGTPEISIVRKLDRTGEGEYRLAGARCRLVDVIELLSDTGLGKEMHSVISQGRVEAVVTSKPRDRRALVEEAAGLGKHRKRRRRAQLKLERTQHNLDRALDVEREARARLRPLKRQAEAAELHARLERQMLEARWELAQEDVRERAAALDAAQTVVGQVRERRQAIERELEQVAGARQAAEDALTSRSARREELSRRCFAARAALERVVDRGEAMAAGKRAIEARIAHGRERLDAHRAAPEAAEDTAEFEARIATLEQELDVAMQEHEAELRSQVQELERELERARAELSERSRALADLSEARARCEQELRAAREALSDAAREAEASRLEAARIGSELASVNRALRGYEALASGVRTLGDGLEVDAGYEVALSAALDGRLRAALAGDRPGAERLLNSYSGEGGRVLVPPSHSGSVAAARVAPVSGAEALAGHVRAQGEAAKLVALLLSDVWVVDGFEGLRADFDGVAVTRAGRAWSPRSGELRQVPAVGDEQMLAQRNRREQLLRETEHATQRELSAGSRHERAIAEVARCEGERERTVGDERAALRARDAAVEEQGRLGSLIDQRRALAASASTGARQAALEAELQAQRRLLQRAVQERDRRQEQLARLEAMLAQDEHSLPALNEGLAALRQAADVIGSECDRFEQALAADRQAGEEISVTLRRCAQREATLQARLHGDNEALTQAEVGAQRTRDQFQEASAELGELAARLGLAAESRQGPLSEEQRGALMARLERLARRREQLGPVNPLAAAEYEEAVAHVEELERQREDLETALRELERLIRDTDRQINECFDQTFAATAQNFDELVRRLFPGGTGRLRLMAERQGPASALGGHTEPANDDAGDFGSAGEQDDGPSEVQAPGIEIEIMPAGKRMQRLSLLSGGEKSLTALAFLFAVFLARPCPFYILDEVEAALDDLNIDRFIELLRSFSDRAQFIVVTHQKRTMEAADCLYGVVMGGDGISKVLSRRLPAAKAA